MMSLRRVMVSMAWVAAAQAQQFGGYSGGSGGPYNGDSGSGSGAGSGSSPGSGSANYGARFNVDLAMRTRTVHGILGAVAMVILFPGGAILLRLLPGRAGLWAHILLQMASLVVLLAAVGMGIRLVIQVQEFGVDLMADPDINYHPIIGLVVVACLLVQPVLGYIHHEKFKRVRRRQLWSYLHLYNGRAIITLGIVNGGFGLWMAQASDQIKMAYVSAAGCMWATWMATGMWSEWRRWWSGRQPWRRKPNPGEVSF